MLLSVNGLGLEFGSAEIFSNMTFNINAGDRVALVGVNGAGKTSLLRILSGDLDHSSGRVNKSGNLRIGYLPQQISQFPGGALLEAVCAGSGDGADALSREEELHSILEKEGTTNASVLAELAKVQDKIHSTEAYNLESKAQAVLSGLGFSKEDLDKDLSDFSGGWKMRAMLAAILLNNPDLILLDEPTNHLDLDARLWLEEFLRRFKGAAWIISHDPTFLDRVTNRVVEIEFGNMKTWGGNYSFYVKEKLVQAALMQKQARKVDDEREKLERFVRKFKATESKRFQVRSREKMLEKLEAVATYKSPKRMVIQPPNVPRSGTKVLQMENVSKAYDKTVFAGVNLEIQRGDRIGIVGKNGGGKSTLSRLFANIEDPTSGKLTKGTGVKIGYYSQEIDLQLNEKHTVLQHVHSISPARSEREIRSYLGRYLFTGDDVMKPVSVLSGGEVSRLALAGILMMPTNFLILDEPTNHLDIFSRDVLQEALKNYKGTLVLISHDEKLLSALSEKLFVVKDEKVKAFAGNFFEYVEKLRTLADQQFKKPDEKANQESGREAEKERKRNEAAERNMAYKERRRKEKRVERIEKKMAPFETRRMEIEALFTEQEVINNSQLLVELQKEHSYLSDEIALLEEQWMEIASEE
ncbi:MAG: ABC-F family ATP-binding cassette domain-containing protein [Candidatus Sabulitectum sp.]|nr:ABC-F family ATP-binding cassette domain-containing protein [Candidatus Sabulitectum sp.]